MTNPEGGSHVVDPAGGYRRLRAWQSAVDLAAECYALTAGFPASERFGLTAQMRAAAVSIVSNIAEGHGRGSRRAFQSFLGIALGSLKELEAQIILAERLGFLDLPRGVRARVLCDQLGGMLHRLRRAVGRRPAANDR